MRTRLNSGSGIIDGLQATCLGPAGKAPRPPQELGPNPSKSHVTVPLSASPPTPLCRSGRQRKAKPGLSARVRRLVSASIATTAARPRARAAVLEADATKASVAEGGETPKPKMTDTSPVCEKSPQAADSRNCWQNSIRRALRTRPMFPFSDGVQTAVHSRLSILVLVSF